VTNATGGVVEDSDFYPFGGERVVTDTLNNNYKFTGHERDGESGLDYFVARHYAFSLGRFLQPDLPFADQRPGIPKPGTSTPTPATTPSTLLILPVVVATLGEHRAAKGFLSAAAVADSLPVPGRTIGKHPGVRATVPIS
jgi:RHS repeat-associated protein